MLTPPAQSCRCRLHIRLWAAIAEAEKMVAPGSVEIHSWADRDTSLLQHARAESGAVVRSVGDVGEQIERALGRRQTVEACLRQRGQQMVA